MHKSTRPEHSSTRPAVILATSMAKLITSCTSQQVRLLIDPGSELSFISDSLIHQCRIKRWKSSIIICGIGGQHSSQTLGCASITLKSNHSEEMVHITVHILKKLTSSLPSMTIPQPDCTHLANLKLADPEFMSPRPVDIIIGADVYGQIIKDDIIKSTPDLPIAQLTIFGWTILGPIDQHRSRTVLVNHSAQLISNQDMDQLLTQFWVQEEVPNHGMDQLTPEEQECENHFMSTHSRDQSGRYTVRIPFKKSPTLLGHSLLTAQRCLSRLKRRLVKDPDYEQLYSSFISEYERLDHMQLVDQPTDGTSHPYYLPHHGVLKADSTTTKLRVVFNASSPTSTGYSLNDIQHTGAKLQRDLSDVLIWLRQFQFMFSTDITKMYRQVNVHPDDWDFQRILWCNEDDQLIKYRLTTVTYGTRSAPFLAIRTLLQLINDDGHRYPLAIDPLQHGRYVDDIFGGADDINTLMDIAQDVKGLCMAGGFPLAKWNSNHPQFLEKFMPSSTERHSIQLDDNSTKLLGLSWHPNGDVFKFTHQASSWSKISKRIILSEIAQLFDPLGWLTPFTVQSKMLMQELWLAKLNWDEPVPTHLASKWASIKEDLLNISSISIPRWYHMTRSSKIELHGFSDASQLAMAAVIYIKIMDPSRTHITMVCAKSKVAPLKKLTIPRLELSAAVLLARLTRYVQETLQISHAPITLWTDSSATLAWITSHPSRWKEFVRNRVSIIQELTPSSMWRFVPGKQNPADCASRGLTISQLQKHHLWWTGPPWLINSPSSWPNQAFIYDSSIHQEEIPGLALNVTPSRHNTQWEIINRFSSLTRLLRVTSICFRVLRRIKMVSNSHPQPLTPQEINEARTLWIRSTQAAFFSSEMKALSSGSLPQHHAFNRLTPFIDTKGILRVGGRLGQAHLDHDTAHPAIIPRQSHFTQLLIEDAHERTLHGGTQLTLNHLRQAYWIMGGRSPVRSLILRCIKCARQRGVRAQQLMGQLPSARVTPSRPFSVSGVDYAGPLTIRTWRGRGAKQTKGWLCIFVCFVTSAVHLEVATEYTTDSFIAAFRRFTGRRGACHTLHSDCGTNFEGAAPQLKSMMTQGTQEQLTIFDTLTHHGTHWKFNPPAAPHMGGKWEAAVKSVKFHLNRTIGDATLTLEELNTLLVQIESVLNSRPLEPLTEDPEDVQALTPAHFLIGEPLNTLPEPSLLEINPTRLKRWQFIQQRLQFFWNRWSTQYLQTQLARSKWHHPSNIIKVGSLVLVTDERLPPSKWPLARVTDTHPGPDGLIRVVTIKTATSTLKRPIAKLAVLPVPEDNSSINQPDHQTQPTTS